MDDCERCRHAEELKAYAANLTAPPRRQSRNEVTRRGVKALSTILWQGRQWAVTTYGVEARDGTYAIEAVALWDTEDGGWVWHMAGKGWVDLDDFAEALRLARRCAPRTAPPDDCREK